MYALINKFDGKNSKSMKKDEVRNFVYDLLKNEQGELISKQNIFPVSSQNAYLANRARQTITQLGRLPDLDPENPSWVDDFCEKAFGESYDDDALSDAEEVTKCANRLWKSSHFHEPLEGVILVAHAHAAILAVDSAAAKLVDVAQAMQNICTTRETALQKNTSELQALAKALQADIQKINECEVLATQQQKKKLDQFKKNLRKQLERVIDSRLMQARAPLHRRDEQEFVPKRHQHRRVELRGALPDVDRRRGTAAALPAARGVQRAALAGPRWRTLATAAQ
jgi:hypothetical protein